MDVTTNPHPASPTSAAPRIVRLNMRLNMRREVEVLVYRIAWVQQAHTRTSEMQ
jgi:hypothetical protein